MVSSPNLCGLQVSALELDPSRLDLGRLRQGHRQDAALDLGDGLVGLDRHRQRPAPRELPAPALLAVDAVALGGLDLPLGAQRDAVAGDLQVDVGRLHAGQIDRQQEVRFAILEADGRVASELADVVVGHQLPADGPIEDAVQLATEQVQLAERAIDIQPVHLVLPRAESRADRHLAAPPGRDFALAGRRITEPGTVKRKVCKT
jgi:hypothetical protein